MVSRILPGTSTPRHPGLATGMSVLVTLVAQSPAVAHTRERPVPETIWSSWNLDPLIALGILFGSWLYLRGVAALWRVVGEGKVIRRWQYWAFVGGMVSIVLALVSPLDALGAALFSAHMVQHVLLFLVAPMLFAASRPGIALSWALPGNWRKRVLTASHRHVLVRVGQGLLSNPVAVWMVFTGVLWIWHVPALYDAALQSDLVHQVEHVSFMAAAFMFWSWLLQPTAGRATRHGIAVLFLFTTVMQSGLLGAILTFAPSPIYEGHARYTEAWNLAVLEDQQLAGLIMWIPMGLWFTVTTVAVFIAWLRDAERSVKQWEPRLDGSPTRQDAMATSQGR